MLVLMALTWLRQGHDVHLVSVDLESLAAIRLINHVVQVSMRDDPTTPSVMSSVHLHVYDFYNEETYVDKAINILTATRGSDGPYVICDEFGIVDSHNACYHRFVKDLCTLLPNVCLWAASPRHDQIPAELQEERMTAPLRCLPAVLSEVQKGIKCARSVYPYTTTTLATLCDRPNIIHLSHQGPEHIGRWPLECVKCRHSIARILQRLGVGVKDSGVNNHSNTVTVCPPLQYRDVFVLTRSFDLRDVKDEAGRVMSTANGVVRGLPDAGIPVCVIRDGHWSTDLCDTAERQSDVVTLTYFGEVTGLERKVVVCLPGRNLGVDDIWTDEQVEVDDRFFAMSHCTAQLVVVDATVSDGDRNVAVQTTKICCLL